LTDVTGIPGWIGFEEDKPVEEYVPVVEDEVYEFAEDFSIEAIKPFWSGFATINPMNTTFNNNGWLPSDFTFFTSWGAVTITGLTAQGLVKLNSTGGAMTIVDRISNLPVKGIGKSALVENATLTSLIIPDTVTNIDEGAFNGCPNLRSITFRGNTCPYLGKTNTEGTIIILSGVFHQTINGVVIPVPGITDMSKVTIRIPRGSLSSYQNVNHLWQFQGATFVEDCVCGAIPCIMCRFRKGDVNGDGSITNNGDIFELIKYIGNMDSIIKPRATGIYNQNALYASLITPESIARGKPSPTDINHIQLFLVGNPISLIRV
jgi:hypothetical protein